MDSEASMATEAAVALSRGAGRDRMSRGAGRDRMSRGTGRGTRPCAVTSRKQVASGAAWQGRQGGGDGVWLAPCVK
jgi:hypothetical protein